MALAWILATACACRVSTADHPLVRAYLGAEPVTPTWRTDITPPVPTWSAEVELGGVAVTVSASGCIGGRFVARYSDERDARSVFTPGDYVYPAELRVARREHVVYGRASGPAGGIWSVTKVFAYDLDRRRLLASAEVDPAVLPPSAEPLAPQPER
jgi:hypothetical protein